MMRQVLGLLVGGAFAVHLLGCSRPASLVVKASSSSSRHEPAVQGLEVFASELGSLTDGRIRVEVYPNSSLGNEREVVELTIVGAVELVCPSNAPLATFVPELAVFELPYLFRDRSHMVSVLDGPLGKSFDEPLRKRGLRLLGYFDLGYRHLMTRGRVVESIEDLAGLKIRTMENALHLRAFEAFGASPLPMAYGEVYTALQQGVIDGAEAARTNYRARRFFEVAPHWSEIGWMYIVSPLVMSERFYQGLSVSDRRAVHQAARKAIAWERKEYARQEEEALGELLASGIQVTRPSREKFMEAARRVWKEASKDIDMAFVDAIQNEGR